MKFQNIIATLFAALALNACNHSHHEHENCSEHNHEMGNAEHSENEINSVTWTSRKK